MIIFENLSYSYPEAQTPVLQDLSLIIEDGEFVLVIGDSGAGKSTLLRCLNGLVPHFYGGTVNGRLNVQGRNPIEASPKEMSKHVGFVFQDPEAQFVVDTVEAELAFAMENHNLPQSIMRKRVEEVLDQLNIAHLRNRRISTLSGGEKQRVAIASVLTLQPQILVLDEPTSQLDPQAAEEVLTVLQQLNSDLGLTIVLSEHRLERVVQYADRILYLPGPGQPLLDGSPSDVLGEIDLLPPLIQLGKILNWEPLPLTIKTARRETRKLAFSTPREANIPAAPNTETTDVAVRDLWYDYDGHSALRGVSLDIQKGEFVALMGRNGSGKTTLLKHIVGLLQPGRGHVRIQGTDTKNTTLEQLVRVVGYVPQNPNSLLFADTVEQELRFTRDNHGLSHEFIPELLARLGLSEVAQSYPRDLSVGQRQRVGIAAILAGEPTIIVLDEPTRGVDYRQKAALIDYLAGERERGRTVILSTHDVELVAASVDRVIILGEGQVVVDGPTRQVMTNSMVFASQINKLFRDDRFLTVDDVCRHLAPAASTAVATGDGA